MIASLRDTIARSTKGQRVLFGAIGAFGGAVACCAAVVTRGRARANTESVPLPPNVPAPILEQGGGEERSLASDSSGTLEEGAVSPEAYHTESLSCRIKQAYQRDARLKDESFTKHSR